MKSSKLNPGKPLQRRSRLKPGKGLARKKTLASESSKRREQKARYRPRRDLFLQENPWCQVEGCNRPSCDVHHRAKGNGERLLDETLWMAVCRQCHDKIEHQERAWAYQQGYAVRVNRKMQQGETE